MIHVWSKAFVPYFCVAFRGVDNHWEIQHLFKTSLSRIFTWSVELCCLQTDPKTNVLCFLCNKHVPKTAQKIMKAVQNYSDGRNRNSSSHQQPTFLWRMISLSDSIGSLSCGSIGGRRGKYSWTCLVNSERPSSEVVWLHSWTDHLAGATGRLQHLLCHIVWHI